MFDIGFSELLLFGVIALIVLGPEKLPQAARTAGQWYAKLRRTVSTLQSEIEAELDLAETRQQMQKELAKIRQTEAEMKREMAEMRGSLKEFEYSQNQSLNAAGEPDDFYNPSEIDKLDKPDSLESTMALNTPADFAYDYSPDEKAEASINLSKESSDNYVDDSFDEDFDKYLDENYDDTSKHPADISATSNKTLPHIVTRPWENMWFRLGAYDKARRLPAPPRLPNYQADVLLRDSFSHPDLDAKMPPIQSESESERLESASLAISSSSLDSNSANNGAQNELTNPPFSLNKQKADK